MCVYIYIYLCENAVTDPIYLFRVVNKALPTNELLQVHICASTWKEELAKDHLSLSPHSFDRPAAAGFISIQSSASCIAKLF